MTDDELSTLQALFNKIHTQVVWGEDRIGHLEERLGELQEEIDHWKSECELLRSVVEPLKKAQTDTLEGGEGIVDWHIHLDLFNEIWFAIEKVRDRDGRK